MQHQSCLLPRNPGSSPRVVSGAVSRQGGLSCSLFNRIYEAMCQYRNRSEERNGHAMDVLMNVMNVLMNHGELHIESKRVRASWIRF
jgi:hypothetical protein